MKAKSPADLAGEDRIARSRAASKSRAFSGGRNLAVDRRIRFPPSVPTIRIGQVATLPAHGRWSHSGRVQGRDTR